MQHYHYPNVHGVPQVVVDAKRRDFESYQRQTLTIMAPEAFDTAVEFFVESDRPSLTMA